jgi:ABC-2 type transport system ATP-binding protein
MIEIRNLTKRFDKVVAVDNLSLTVNQGEIFGFLGPNGAGKTTTIKIMTGLLRPTSGMVRIGGFDIQQETIPAKRIIGYVPEDPFVYDKLSGQEFLTFIGGLYSLEGRNLEAKVESWLNFFGLNDNANQLTESYSHGMRQKLVMSAALLHEPKVLIIDEPVVGLDPKSTRMLKDLLKSLAKQGTTVFLSTHILSIAEELCDRVGIIHQGRLITIGSIPELKQVVKESADSSLESIFLKLTEE